MSCKWDAEAEVYLSDGEPCRRDDHGDPTKHCTNRRSCGQHIGLDELTCARCIGRTRNDVRAIPGLVALLWPLALGGGVESQAVNLSGPAADPEAWSWRKVTARRGGTWHVSLEEDDDERHPLSVLARWEFMLREDYQTPAPEVGCTSPGPRARRQDCASDHGPDCWDTRQIQVTLADAAAYLDRTLHRVAQDPEQDFRDLSRDMRRVRRHLESVLHNSHAAERGAPCPICRDQGIVVKLLRVYGHWCWDEDCCREHFIDDQRDEWVCPRNREQHRWTQAQYEAYVEERMGA